MENSLDKPLPSNNEDRVDMLAACRLLEVEPHTDIDALLIGLEEPTLGVRVSMLQQLQLERVRGSLVRRGPGLSLSACECTPSPYWCSKADRAKMLDTALKALQAEADDEEDATVFTDGMHLGHPREWSFAPGALLEKIREQYPYSCLTNLHCFELAVVRKVLAYQLTRRDDGTYTLGGQTPTLPTASLQARKRWDEGSKMARPHANHYRESTIFD